MPTPPLALNQASKRAALIRMHGATLLFGLSGIFGVLCTASASALVCGRALFAVAALGLCCLLMRSAPWRGLQLRDYLGLVLSGMLLTAHFVTFFLGVKWGGVAVGTLGFACFPAFTTLFEALLFRERPSRRDYYSIFFVSIGLMLITPSFDLDDTATKGLLWGVASGAIYALTAAANRSVAQKSSGMHAALWQNLVIIICLLPFTTSELLDVSAQDLLWIACLGLLCTALAYSLYVSSLKALKARQAAVIIALEPVYAIAAAWLLFADVPDLRMTLGGLLIVGTVWRAGRA